MLDVKWFSYLPDRTDDDDNEINNGEEHQLDLQIVITLRIWVRFIQFIYIQRALYLGKNNTHN